MSYRYDPAGRMTRITWPDGFHVAYDHDLTGAVTAVRANGATSGAGVLATYGYSDLGQLTGVMRGNGAGSSYGYDAHARLTSLSHNPAGTAADLTLGFGYNPAGQIATRTVGNPAYAHASTGGQDNGRNGLNQLTAITGAPVTYDANGNTTGVLGSTYGYDPANRLTGATTAGGPGASSFAFDPLNRLATTTTGTASTRFQYAGVQLTAEYDATGTLTRRHIPGLGLDGVIASYAGTGVASPSWLLADERGSVIALTDGTGAATTLNRYDDYGVPAAGNMGRFQYTGQAWLAEAGAYHYRARTYLPQTGRFLQTDPIGYQAGMNLYGYVGMDPVNMVDPMGLQECVPNGRGGYNCGEVVSRCGHACRAAAERLRDFIEGSINRIDPNGQHFYVSDDRICVESVLGCTATSVYQCLLKNPAPGAENRRTPISDGSISNIRVQFFGFDAVEGPVRHQVIPEAMAIINETLPGHDLYYGEVFRAVTQRSFLGVKSFYVHTIGTGQGRTPRANERSANVVWGSNSIYIAACVATGGG